MRLSASQRILSVAVFEPQQQTSSYFVGLPSLKRDRDDSDIVSSLDFRILM